MKLPQISNISAKQFREAFLEVEPLLSHIDAKELIPITVDVQSAVITVIGCAPRLRSLRESVFEPFPAYDPTSYDNVEKYALALGHAHARHIAASAPPEPLPDLVATLTPIREQLLADVRTLARRGLLDEQRLKEIRVSTGYKNLAFDVLLLVTMLRDRWDQVSGKCAVTIEELDRAETLTERLTAAIGFKKYGSAAKIEATLTRQRSYTLLVNAYDDVRRLVTFNRWHKRDVDRIAPSLFRGRGGRGPARTGSSGASQGDESGAAVTTAATNGSGRPEDAS